MCFFMSELCSDNLMCSFHDRRLNSTQGEIRVGPSHQVKWILVTSLIGFYFLLFNWSFILLSSNLELFLCYLEFYINAKIYFLKTTTYFKKIMVKYIQSKINHSDHFKVNGSVPISIFTSLCSQSPEPIQLPNLKLSSHETVTLHSPLPSFPGHLPYPYTVHKSNSYRYRISGISQHQPSCVWLVFLA